MEQTTKSPAMELAPAMPSGTLAGLMAAVLRSVLPYYPFRRGQSRILYSRFIHRLRPHLVAHGDIVLRNRLRASVLPRDDNAIELALFGETEPGLVDVLRQLLRPADVFLDIGANYGGVSLLLSDRLPAGRIHLFEPQPSLAACLARTLCGSLPCPIELHPIALYDRDGECTFMAQPGHSGSGSLVRRDAGWNATTVPTRNVATYLPRLIAGANVGVKIDVEGAEHTLLPWLLSRPEVAFIAFEAGFLADTDRLCRDIWSRGFALFGVRSTLRRTYAEPIDGHLVGHKDLIAVRPDRLAQLRAWSGGSRALPRPR